MPETETQLAPREAYDRIVRRLKGLGAYRRRVKVTFGLLLLICGLLAAGTLALGLDALFFLPATGRQILLTVCGLGLLAVLAGFIVLPLVLGPSPEKLARMTDARHPELRNALVTALQLWRHRQKNPEGYSTELIEAAVAATERRTRCVDFKSVVDTAGIKRALRLGASLLGLAVILFLLFPAPLSISARRLSHPRTPFQRPPQTTMTVSPGDIQVTRHSDVIIRARIDGRIPDEVRIAWKEGEARWREEGCTRQAEREFIHLFADLKRDIIYRVSGGDAGSQQFNITVIDRPHVVRLRLRYDYPSYTGLEPRVVEEDGNISAVVGTVVEMELEANRELESAWLSFGDGRRLDLDLSAQGARGRLDIRESGSYFIGLQDRVGNQDQDPIQYRIEAVADEPPMAQITFPAENVDLGEEMKLPLAFLAQDDYGLSRAVLLYKTIRDGQEQEEQQISIALPGKDPARAEVDYLWTLTDLDLIPEDLVAYKVAVWDNDRISGPKRADSRTYTVRFPSLHELLAQVQEEQSLQIADVEEVLEEERVFKERLDQIRRELETEDAISWEQKKDVEMALEQKEAMAQEMARIAEAMDENIDRAQERRVASMEIMEKMEQVRQLMEEVATPEMKKALEDLRRAMQDLDPELVKQQMDQLSLDQEELIKRLDRTLSILKRLQAEQQLDALVKRTEDMLQRQSEIMEKMEPAEGMDSDSTRDMEKLAAEQQRLGEDAAMLPDEMKDLSELMSQFPEMPAEQLAKMADNMEASQMPQQMSQAAQKMSQGNRKGARKQQEQAQQMLQQLNSDLQMLQNQMGGQMMKEMADAIRGSISDLLAISQEQEEHRSQVQRLDRESAQFGTMAEEQLSLLEAASRVAGDIYDIAQKTFFVSPRVGQALGQAMAQMKEAMGALESRGGSDAIHSEKEAMVALNNAARYLINALQSMGTSCSSGGMESMMQQLQGMTQSQMGINQQTLDLGQQGQQSQLTMDQRAQMARLAAEQAAVQKQLSDLLKEFGDRSEILGRLDQLGEEMKKVVDELARRQVDQGTIDRQQRILSRLLDAQKSARSRDYSRRRQSRPGQMVLQRSPGELPAELEDAQEQLRRDLLQALSENYPKAYEELIRAYFEALSRTP